MDRANRGGGHRPHFLSLRGAILCLAFLVIAGWSKAVAAPALIVSGIAAADKASDDIDSIYEKGRSLERAGEIEKAIDAYNQVLRKQPDDRRARGRLRRLQRLGYDIIPRSTAPMTDGPPAVAAGEKAELSSATQTVVDNALQKARIYLESEQPAEAERELREAMRMAPDHPEIAKLLDEAAALRKTLADREREKAAEADRARRKVLESSASEKFQEGTKYYLAGDVIRAVQTWREALAIYPDHEPSKNAIESARSEYEKAVKEKQEAEKLAAQEREYEAKLDLKYGYETKGDSDIDDVLNTLSNLCGLNIVIGEDVEGTVSFRFDKGTSIREILNHIQDNYGFAWERKGDTIIVRRAFKTKVFPLTEVQYKTLKAILENPETLEDTSQDLRAILYGPDGSKKMPGKELFLNARTRSLVVTDTENNLAKVQEFLDHMPAIAAEDRPLETRLYRLHPEIAKDLYRIIELRLYQDVGQYGGLTGEGRKLFLDEASNTLMVIDYPENIQIVEDILADESTRQSLQEEELKAEHFSVTDMFDIGQREEDLDRRVNTTRMVVEVLEAMLYGPTGKEEARLRGRRMFPDETRGTIDIVDTPSNLKRVRDYLASIRGEAAEDIIIQIFRIKHIPVYFITDVIGSLFFNQQQGTPNIFLDVQGLDTLGTDEQGQQIDLSSGFEETARDLPNIEQAGGAQDLTQLFSLSVYPDLNTNSLVVITPDTDALNFITNIINAFDRPPRMLEIEQRVVSVTLNDLRAVGLDYLILNPFRSKITVNPDKSDQEVLLLQQEGKQSLRFTVDTFGETRLNFVLSLIEEMSSAEVISAPKMLYVPNYYTYPLIFVGEQQPYISNVEIDDQGDDDPTNNRLILDFERAITGFRFRFIAYILNDDHVWLDMMPDKSEITSRLPVFAQAGAQGAPGIDTSTLTSLGQPVFSQQAMLTTVRVKSGETIVMGGMMQDSVTESRLSVPLISKLPFIGSLFQDVSYNISKTTYLFFVTVRILEGEAGTTRESTTVSGLF